VKRSTRRQRVALVVLLLVAAVFVTLDAKGNGFGGVRSGAQAVFGPVQRGLSAVFSPVGRLLGAIPHLATSRRDIEELRRQNDDLRRQLAERALHADRTGQLHDLTLLAGLGRYRVLPAAVVGLGPSLGFEWTATIDAGSTDGVKPDMTVLTGAGLVGRVKQVSAATSLIVLAGDPAATVGARMAGTGELGLVTGGGTGSMSLTLLNPNAVVRPGDRLVTGPYGQSTYVAGVPIGEVIGVGTGGAGPPTATVRPYVQFTRLDVVGVVLVGPRTDPRDSVLPPPPPATSAPGTSTPATSTPGTSAPTVASTTGSPR